MMTGYVPVAEIQAQQVRVCALVERRAVAARAVRLPLSGAGDASQTGTPFLDRANRYAGELCDFAVY
jgi:hypothetical protein